jgi:hypothetical protein
MEVLLVAFRNRCACTIKCTFIQCEGAETDKWVYPAVATALKAAYLQPLQKYLDKRLVTFRDTYEWARELYARCETSTSIAQPFPTLWDQLNNTILDGRDPELTSSPGSQSSDDNSTMTG